MSSADETAMPRQPGSPQPPPSPKVHPLAKRLAGLMSPMSLKDQAAAMWWCNHLIYGSVVLSFPVAYYMQDFFVAILSILSASVIAFLVCVPNWRQRPDLQLKAADDKDVWDYYQSLKAARGEAPQADKAAEGKAK